MMGINGVVRLSEDMENKEKMINLLQKQGMRDVGFIA